MTSGKAPCIWVEEEEKEEEEEEEAAAFVVLLLQARKTWENGWTYNANYFHHLQVFCSAVSSK